ncbi:MAG: copper chaperone PCu(A)C [Chloroflexota bacterium]
MTALKRATALLLLAAIALAAVACGSSSASANTAGGPLTVKSAWARAAASGADTAVYFTIVNGRVAADTLLSATSTVAKETGIHQTSTDASGMMGMHMVPSVAIPGGGTVEFAPGGYHVMLTGLTQDLTAGGQVQITLTFQNAGTVTVTAEVRAN